MATSHEDDPPPNGTRPADPSRRTSGRRATIMDVARAADVSVSAVSKVLRNAYGVSPQMRERVTAAIESLGYRPNAGARSMRGRSYTIGVVIAEFGTPFQLEIAQAIADELEPTSFHVVVVAGGVTPERQKPRIEGLIDRQVDGLILVAPFLDAASIERVGQGLPIVTVALHGAAQHFDTVVTDERLGTRLVVDHLVALGHRQIVHTSAASGAWDGDFVLSHTARRLGFEQAMRDHNLEPDIIETYYSEEGGYDAAVQAFSRDPRPTAIFAGADIAALGVLRAAEERGLRVPEDVTVVGYDNIYATTINRVSLTTVDQSGHSTGAASVRLLLERINGRTEPKQFVVAPQLITRRTSGPPETAFDQELAANAHKM